ncbi:MAG: quinone oxidoreductase [Actinobacteria bacterium]|nr:MAG: quinone oxidoreductase [Actinomycetota bacterium]
MRAIAIERHGGPEVLELRDVPGPEPGAGELLVDTAAIGVNYRDVYERTIPGYAGPLPRVVGVEGAGTVRAVGAEVEDVRPGDRVAWVQAPGSYAEQVVVAAENAVPVPDGVSDEQAAAVLLQGITAQYPSSSTYPVAEGDRVVVHAAAGGVGLLLTQLVRLRGGGVLATTSSDEKAELARGAGAEEVVGYDEFRERASAFGVDAVYDGVGAATFDAGLEALRPRGTMVLYGAASGRPSPVEPGRLAARSLFLTRPSLHHYTATRAELLERAQAVLELVAAGKLDVRIGARYPLEEARRAHEDLESRRTTGKLLLLPR